VRSKGGGDARSEGEGTGGGGGVVAGGGGGGFFFVVAVVWGLFPIGGAEQGFDSKGDDRSGQGNNDRSREISSPRMAYMGLVNNGWAVRRSRLTSEPGVVLADECELACIRVDVNDVDSASVSRYWKGDSHQPRTSRSAQFQSTFCDPQEFPSNVPFSRDPQESVVGTQGSWFRGMG